MFTIKKTRFTVVYANNAKVKIIYEKKKKKYVVGQWQKIKCGWLAPKFHVQLVYKATLPFTLKFEI